MVLTSLPAAVFLSSNPQAAYAGTPVYDPVFYYYHPDNLGSSQLMTDRDGDVVQQYGYTPFGRENYKNNTLAFSVSSRYTTQVKLWTKKPASTTTEQDTTTPSSHASSRPTPRSQTRSSPRPTTAMPTSTTIR